MERVENNGKCAMLQLCSNVLGYSKNFAEPSDPVTIVGKLCATLPSPPCCR